MCCVWKMVMMNRWEKGEWENEREKRRKKCGKSREEREVHHYHLNEHLGLEPRVRESRERERSKMLKEGWLVGSILSISYILIHISASSIFLLLSNKLGGSHSTMKPVETKLATRSFFPFFLSPFFLHFSITISFSSLPLFSFLSTLVSFSPFYFFPTSIFYLLSFRFMIRDRDLLSFLVSFILLYPKKCSSHKVTAWIPSHMQKHVLSFSLLFCRTSFHLVLFSSLFPFIALTFITLTAQQFQLPPLSFRLCSFFSHFSSLYVYEFHSLSLFRSPAWNWIECVTIGWDSELYTSDLLGTMKRSEW